jgi:MinD-like ATPase involved in chromosome partitioning or flagellar assembly
MKRGPYVIRVSSQKGGVGKTTIAVNIATALSMLDYKVLLIDGDYVNPAVGFHLGLDQVNKGFIDVVSKGSDIKIAIVPHTPTGMHVLPGRISSNISAPNREHMQALYDKLGALNYDFVIFDTPPGLMPDDDYAYLKNYDEAIIITTPEMSSCTSAIRLAHIYDDIGLKHSLIVNRVKNKGYEVSEQEIEESYGGTVTGSIPEDDIVPLSISEHIPAYLLNRKCRFSVVMGRAAKRYGAKMGSSYTMAGEQIGLLERILAFLGFRRRRNRIRESLEE